MRTAGEWASDTVTMSGRIRSQHPQAHAWQPVAAFILGAVLAAAGVFLLMHRSPDQPGTGPCADAAEAYAQVDETARYEYVKVRPGSNQYAPTDQLIIARGRAHALLEDCRAAGQ